MYDTETQSDFQRKELARLEKVVTAVLAACVRCSVREPKADITSLPVWLTEVKKQRDALWGVDERPTGVGDFCLDEHCHVGNDPRHE